jgi:hypothetical protein
MAGHRPRRAKLAAIKLLQLVAISLMDIVEKLNI